MKGLLLAIVAFCLMFLGCSFSSHKGKAQNDYNDTVICSKLINDEVPYEDWEYFVKYGKDTSAYSCIITSREGKWSSIELWRNIKGKYYFFLGDCNENDTTAIGERIVIPERVLRIPCYKEMLREIDLCIEAASKNKDVTTLTYFSSSLSYLSDIAVLTTNNLLSHFSVRWDGQYNLSDIGKALNMTPFAKDISTILNKYGIEVDRVSCEERRDNFGKDEFLRYKKISKDISVPDTIMNAEVYVSIKNLENVDLE